MLFQSFLIKYAEIGTKGKNRFLFEDALMKQIRHALKEVDGTFTISKESGRIYVDAEGDYDYDEAIEAMKYNRNYKNNRINAIDMHKENLDGNEIKVFPYLETQDINYQN